MNLKQYVRYQMNFSGKWVTISAVLIGASFFLRMLYFFALTDISAWRTGQIIFDIILPLLLFAGYFALLGVLKWNAPGIYGILGTVMCIFLFIWCCGSGDIVRIILGIVFYLVLACALLATAGGYLPWRLPACMIILIIILGRILFYFPKELSVAVMCMELSVICIPAALFALVRGFKEAQ